MLYTYFMLQLLSALRKGMGIEQAVWTVLHNEDWWIIVAIIVLVYLLGYLVTIKFMIRRTGKKQRVHNLRRFGLLAGMLLLIVQSIFFIFIVAIAGWDIRFWIFVVPWLLNIVLLLYFLGMKDNPEQVEALKTGDFSRVNDERIQAVMSRSALAALNIFLRVLLFGGFFYDVVVTRQWPIRTLIEFVVIGIIWTATATWWNRKL